ncbi:MAG: TonB-dependent receptor plug domain-containing protein, partial [Parvularculaceae bacterium]|nr:TonB-dependent receptor plug domain-containing protein [Parvularculaceae bacterium]
MKATRFLIAGVSVTALMHAMPALAQDEDASAVGYGIDIITVTAQKKAESIQDTPISIVAFEGEAMSAEGRNEIRDVLDRVAGLTFKNAAYGATSINLRGIEGINGAQGKTDPAVPLYFDGVVQPALLGDPGTTTFFDIDRLEVLRGPQGTLYGRGASAGLVNVITNNPVDEYEAGMAIEVGNYDMTRATGYANIPLAEGVAFRASAQHLRRDSFYTSGANNARQTAARAKLQYEPSDTIRVLVGGEYAKVGGNLGAGGRGAGITAWGLGDPASDPWDDITTDGGLTGQVPGSTQDDDFYKVWGEIDVDLPFANLTVIPGYSEVDRDRVLVRKLGSSPPGVYNSVDNT